MISRTRRTTYLGLLSTLLCAFASFAAAAGDPNPAEVPSPINKIFVPLGWDDNDNVEIVLHGEFVNACYRVANSKYSVDHTKKQITITATSYKYSGDACAEIVLPFLQIVKVGILMQGQYTVTLLNEGAKGQPSPSAFVKVERRKTEDPDDYLYAPVDSADIGIDGATGNQVIELRGRYPLMKKGCANLANILVNRSVKDIVVVQPIMEILDDDECAGHETVYVKSLPLEDAFTGEGLLHVRTLNGNSSNRYLNFKK
jgi:hypothetical protein